MNTKTIEQLQQELDALIAERDEILSFLDQAEAKKRRLAELNPGWAYYGEINSKKLELRDSKFPIYGPYGMSGYWRIIDVTPKWIVLRGDLNDDNEKSFYSKETGHREHSSSDYDNKINVEKALKIWAEFQESKK